MSSKATNAARPKPMFRWFIGKYAAYVSQFLCVILGLVGAIWLGTIAGLSNEPDSQALAIGAPCLTVALIISFSWVRDYVRIHRKTNARRDPAGSPNHQERRMESIEV